MQPCGVCGGMGIDAAGYCTQCRNYRGLPQPAPPPAPQPTYPPAYELMNPSSGAPYAGPSSGPPYASSGPPYAGPTSGAPYPSTYGSGYQQPPTAPAGYPNYQQPQPQPQPTRSRNSFVVPLVALSATLVVLVVAIVVVALIRSGGNKGGGGGTQGNGSPGATSLVDSCVIGDWDETSHKEVASYPQLAGQVTFTGKGAALHLKADGTGVTDYGSGSVYSGTGTLASTGANVQISLKVTGTITFDYRTNDNTVSFSNAVSKADGTATVNGQTAPSSHLDPDTNPASYTCSASSMTQTNSVVTIEYRKR